MLEKITTFEAVYGHSHLKTYFIEQLQRGTLPQFLILEGAEGLGKTTLGKLLAMGLCCTESRKPCYKCASCRAIQENVITGNRSTDAVKLFNMSVDGGKDAARDVLANLTLGVTGLKNKVILLDEAHGMTEQAQDVFLVDTEFLPKGVHIILMTTNSMLLRDTLKSRAFTVRLNPLSQGEVLSLLKRYAAVNQLEIQGGETSLSLLAAWSDGKPRAALNVLGGFAKGQTVPADLLKSFIGYGDTEFVLPLIKLLGGSLVHGVAYIQSLTPSKSISDIAIEALKQKKGVTSGRLSYEESMRVREAVKGVSEDALVRFVYELAALPKLTKEALTAAFVKSHDSYGRLFSQENNDEIITEELRQIQGAERQNSLRGTGEKPPALSELLRNASVVK